MPTQPTATLTNGVHHTEIRVRFGDTDPYGIVYFASYFRYCHRAIEEFLRACGLPPETTFKNVPEGFGLPIVEAWGRFRRPSLYGDLLRIETRVEELRAQGHPVPLRVLPGNRPEPPGRRHRHPGGHRPGLESEGTAGED